MEAILAEWSLILLCFSMAGALGGGLHEHIVLTPPMERFTAIILLDHPARYGRTPSTVLDSRSRGDHHFHPSVSLLHLE